MLGKERVRAYYTKSKLSRLKVNQNGIRVIVIYAMQKCKTIGGT